MKRRTYNQHCSIARALDRIGGRWTLLIVRELLDGPRRFNELLESLKGIGPNLLTERLRDLEEQGFVRRGYELTDAGRELEDVLGALGRFGLKFMAKPNGEMRRPAWAIQSLRSTFQPEEARGIRETYEIRLGDEVFLVGVDDGKVNGMTGTPDLVLSTDPETLLDLVSRRRSAYDAVESGKATLIGDLSTLERMLRIFNPAA